MDRVNVLTPSLERPIYLVQPPIAGEKTKNEKKDPINVKQPFEPNGFRSRVVCGTGAS